MKPSITIPQPCHENWNKMTPQEKGRHCAVCDKVVKDYTGMSDDEILANLKQSSAEVCGRIEVNKLTPVDMRQRISFWLKGTLYRKAAYYVFAVLGFSFLFKKQAQAQMQGGVMVKGKIPYRPVNETERKLTVTVVYEASGKLVSQAYVDIFSGGRLIQSLQTGPKGEAFFMLPPDMLVDNQVSITAKGPNWSFTRLDGIYLDKKEQFIELALKDEHVMIGKMLPSYIQAEETVPEMKDTLKPACTLPDSLMNAVTVYGQFVVEDTTPVIPSEKEVSSVVEEKTTEELYFKTFPVPAWNDFTVESIRENEKFSIEIFDNNGRKIQVVHNILHRHRVDVSSWSPGIYYVLFFINGKAIETKKMIVAKR